MSSRPVLARLLDKWEQQILRPVLVTVLSTCILLVGSLAFKPIRLFLFPPEAIPDYPLYCTAEAYDLTDKLSSTLGVDFFIINRTGEEYNRQALEDFLRKHRPDEPNLSPVIDLNYYRSGKMYHDDRDKEFNADKGEVRVKITPEGTGLQIVPDLVKPRAVLKISIVVTGLPPLGKVTRATRGAVPFEDLDKYQEGCYSR